jgi:DNA polymerase-1
MIFLITKQLELLSRPVNSGIASCDVDYALKELRKMTFIAVDSETTGFDPYVNKLLCLQLGNKEKQFVIDTSDRIHIPIIQELFKDNSKTFLFHNAAFDLRFLFPYFPINIICTFLNEKIINRGLDFERASLADVAYKYLKIVLDKTVRGSIHREGLTTRVIRYAADDIKYLEDIMVFQNNKLQEKGLLNYARLENRFVLPLAYTAYNGMPFNKEKWKEKCNEDTEELSKAVDALNIFVIENFDNPTFVSKQLDLFATKQATCNIKWSSDLQVKKLLDYMGYDLRIEEKGKSKISIDQKHIEKFKGTSPIIDLYIDYSKKAKLNSTYGNNFFSFINKETQRVHTVYTQIMNTGRISSGKVNKKKNMNYPNLQNIPSDSRHRSCFEVKGDNILVVGDYSGQEQIILANASLEPNLLKFYDDNLGDMHSYVASKIFPYLADIDLKVIKEKYKDERQKAKAAGFAINYGGVGMTIARNMNISVEEGNKIYEEYFKAFPKLKAYFNKVINETLKNGYITINTITNSKTYLDRYEHFLELQSDIKQEGFWEKYRKEKEKSSFEFVQVLKPLVRNYFITKGQIERDSLNYPIQGTAAEMTKIAAIYFMEWIIKNNYFGIVKLINLVHDEIVVECPEELAETVKDKLKEDMERAGALFCKRVPIKANPVITKFWYH